MQLCNKPVNTMDFLIVHAQADLDRANELCKRLNRMGYSGELFVPETDCLKLKCKQVGHVLLCISNNIDDKKFLTDKKIVTCQWLETRSLRKNPVHLKSRAFHVNPVHLERLEMQKDKILQSHVLGLMQFTNFYPESRCFDKDVKKEFQSTL